MMEYLCEHDWEEQECYECGGWLGQVCINCGYCYDGGDWMASQEDRWCNCGWGSPNPRRQDEGEEE